MKKYRWIIDLVILTLLAILIADTALVWVRDRLKPSWRPALVRGADPKTPEPGKAAMDAGVILRRNLFAAELEPASLPKPGAVAAAPPALNLRLIGTVDLGGSEAKAILEDKTTKSQKLYRRGDRIGSAQLAEIERRQVVLRDGNRRETLRLTEEVVTIPAPVAPGKAAAAPAAPAFATAGGTNAIQKAGEHTWIVDRAQMAQVEKAAGNVNQVLSSVRILPYFEQGKPAGYMVSQIPPESLLSQMGITNGDVIRKINDVEVTSPEQALGMYQRMKSGSRVTIEVQRNRKLEVFTYRFR